MTFTTFWLKLNSTLAGKKTYFMAASTIFGAASSYLAGQITILQALNLVVPAIIGACVRQGIDNAAKKAANAAVANVVVKQGLTFHAD